MTLAEVEITVEGKALFDFADRPITGVYTSDLLSDVMANADEGQILVTLQAHKNTVACASLVGIAGIVLAGQREAPADMLEAARAEGIAMFASPLRQFDLSWRLARRLGLF